MWYGQVWDSTVCGVGSGRRRVAVAQGRDGMREEGRDGEGRKAKRHTEAGAGGGRGIGGGCGGYGRRVED